MPEYWSWTLTAVGVTGLWLTGSGRWIGAAIGVAAQGLWVAYALTTHQYGFLISAAAYGVVNARNVRRLVRARRTPPPFAPPLPKVGPVVPQRAPSAGVLWLPEKLPAPCCLDGSCETCHRLSQAFYAALSQPVIGDRCTRCIDSCVCDGGDRA